MFLRMRTAGLQEDPVAMQKAIDFADGVIAEIFSGSKDAAAMALRLKNRMKSTDSDEPAIASGKTGQELGLLKMQYARYSSALAMALEGRKLPLYVGDSPKRDDPALKEASNAYGIVDEIMSNPNYGDQYKIQRLQHHIDETDTNSDAVRESNKKSYWPYLDIRNEIYRRALRGIAAAATSKKEPEKKQEGEPKTGPSTVPQNITPTDRPPPQEERQKYTPESQKDQRTVFPDAIQTPDAEPGGPGGISSLGSIRKRRTA